MAENETPPAELKFEGEPWLQQEGETHQAYEAFATYRDLGLKRSAAKVAEKLRKSKTLMDRWCGRWKWVLRVEHYEREQDRLYQIEIAQARKEMATRQAQNGLFLQQLGMKALKQKYGDNLEKLTPKVLKSGSLLKFLMDGAKLERLALGEPTSVQEQQINAGPISQNDRKPIVPLTFQKRIDDALALLETARARATDGTDGAAPG